MNSTWVVDTHRDLLTGQGFQRDAGLSTPSVPDDLRDQFGALATIYSQLVSASDDEGTTSVLTFDYSPGRARWIVVLQGFGAAYGSAGAIQLVAAPVGWGIVEVLPRAFQALGDRLFIEPDRIAAAEVGPPPAGIYGRPVSVALQRMARVSAAPGIVELPGESAAVKAELDLLARLLPEQIARSFRFSTAYAPADVRTGPVVSGAWPDLLRSRHADRYSRVWDPAIIESSGLEAIPSGVSWIVAEAQSGNYPGRNSAATRMEDWLAHLDVIRPWNPGEAMQNHDSGLSDTELRQWQEHRYSRLILTQGRPDWVGQGMRSPYSEVVADTVATCYEELDRFWSRVLKEAQTAAARGEDWSLVGKHLTRDEAIDMAKGGLAKTSSRNRAAAQGWLASLGVTRDMAPDLFPVDATSILDDLRRGKSVEHAALDVLRAPDRTVTLAAVAKALEAERLGRLLLVVSEHDLDARFDLRPLVPAKRLSAQLERILRGAASLNRGERERTRLAVAIAEAMGVELRGVAEPTRTQARLLLFAVGLPVAGPKSWWRRRSTRYWLAISVMALAMLSLGLLLGMWIR